MDNHELDRELARFRDELDLILPAVVEMLATLESMPDATSVGFLLQEAPNTKFALTVKPARRSKLLPWPLKQPQRKFWLHIRALMKVESARRAYRWAVG